MKRFAAAGLIVGLLLAGCTKSGGTGVGRRQNAWTHPHVLTIATADVNTLNPHLGQFKSLGYMSSLTMAYLIRSDERNQARPELATAVPSKANGGISKDGLTITYHLRRGVKWSDGAPFTADDVVFSTNVVLNHANNEINRQGWDLIMKMSEPDKYTLVYQLKKPYSPFVETFYSTLSSNPCVLPKHLLGAYKTINNISYNSLPVGIGPFKYERWDRGQDVVMIANPLYFRGRPKLDKIVFAIIPDRNTMLAQMQAHELDMWPLVPGSYLARLQTTPGVKIVRYPSYEWYHLDFNLTTPSLQDPIVRRALRLGYNREEFLKKIQHGLGALSESPTPLYAPYAVTERRIPYDPALANTLLDHDGWKRGSDGIRAKNGSKLDLRYAVYAGAPDVDDAIELLRQNWQKLGVAIRVKHYPVATFFAPLQEGGIVYDSRKWDVTAFAWQNDALGDYSPIYGCDFPPNGQDDPHWCNPTAMAAMQALYAHYDQAQRNADIKRFVDQFYQDVPVIAVNQRTDVFAFNSDLQDFHPNSVAPFDNFLNVDI